MTRPRILLTHTPEMRRNYYGDRALAGLRELGEVLLHEADEPLDATGLARAAEGAHIIVSDRNTPGYGEIFGQLPDLVAFLRVAVDIRNVDVSAASRGLLAFGMTVLVNDPYVTAEHAGIEQVSLNELVRRADFVIPLAVATEETESLIGVPQLRAMKPTAYLVNLSRGNLIDEAALERALDERWIAGAALDVGRAPDQMPSPHLARRPDVIATPHMGGLTPTGIEGQALETVAQVRMILEGKVPEGAVNADQAHRLKRFAAP